MKEETLSCLEKLEKTSKEFWNISRQTGIFISMLIKAANIKNMLEIGTSNGYSAIWAADALKQTGGHLTTIEFWEKRQCLARRNIQECALSDYVSFKTGQALDVIKDMKCTLPIGYFDLVFMDADKAGYLDMFKEFDPLLKKGGLILADNVISHAEKTAPFVSELTNSSEYQAQVLDLPCGLLMGYKLV